MHEIDNNYLPKTETELETWMKDNGYNFNSYSINGNCISEGHGIDHSDGVFIWYYTERGHQDNLKYFNSESEVVAYAFDKIKSDKWAKTHCIGFSDDLSKIAALKNTLLEMDIEFFEDKIPYYGIERPVYRVFVLGCDIQKTAHLKEQYWTVK